MNASVTLEDIKARFASEWVLVGDPELSAELAVVRGTVLFHGPDRDELYREAQRLMPKRAAVLFTGKIPQGAAVILCAIRSIRQMECWAWISSRARC